MTMEKSELLNELGTALAKAQAEMKNAKKSSNNPFFKSKYADLAEIIDTLRPAFGPNGLSVVQMPCGDGETVSLRTMLLHSSGQYIAEVCSVRPTKSDPQAAGSALTYLRRYSLAAFTGIAQEDDDGNEASNGQKQQIKPAPPNKNIIVAESTAEKANYSYEIWQLDEEKQKSAQEYLEKNNAQFDDEKCVWISSKPLKRLEAYEVK